MSWSLDLTTDRPITPDDAHAIVAALPPDLFGPRGAPWSGWGWSAAADISLPDETTWHLSGAGYSRAVAAPMADALAAGLLERGYRVIVGVRRD